MVIKISEMRNKAYFMAVIIWGKVSIFMNRNKKMSKKAMNLHFRKDIFCTFAAAFKKT